jgi:hypothetical protein
MPTIVISTEINVSSGIIELMMFKYDPAVVSAVNTSVGNEASAKSLNGEETKKTIKYTK